MKTLIYNARLIDPATDLDTHGGLLIEGEEIAAVGPEVTKDNAGTAEAIDAAGMCLAPGLIDLRVKTGEPGEEQRETLETASQAAVAGGITSMVVTPGTSPVIDNVALVQFIQNHAQETAFNRIYPSGALTKGLNGEAMAEIGLMSDAGAVMFSNGDAPIEDPGIFRRVLSYAASLGLTVSVRPEDKRLTGSGVMTSGALAARMGLKGMAPEAEHVGLSRDLILATATGCQVLIDQISTAKSLDIVRSAKQSGTAVHTSIAAHHLFFNELDVGDYLTYCKTNPPFRPEDDRRSLVEALGKGEIDIVVSAHDPQPPEEKRLPFSEASFGAAGLETLLSTLLGLVQDEQVSMVKALRTVTSAPADLLGLPQGKLKPGAPADIILFDPDKPWMCERENLRSRSTNSPFDGRRMVGKTLMTWVAGSRVFAL